MRTSPALFATLLLAASVATGCDTDTDGETVGPRGGTVYSEDGRLAVEIPAGALAQDVEISIKVVDEGPEGSMSPVYAIEPAGLGLQQPAQVIYDYEDGQLAPEDADAVDVLIQRDDAWNYLGDRDVDTEVQAVSASLLYFSSVTVVVE